jgi:GrpB-like predicted nucleotidyltransferase (UPF0157 family)
MGRVAVVPYNPAWPGDFAQELSAVIAALGELYLALHHIGSTSIPGIWAKPVIDLLAVVSSVVDLDARRARFESLGYEIMGEFGIPGRRYSAKTTLPACAPIRFTHFKPARRK